MNKPGSHLILNSDNDQMRVNLEVRTESNMSVNLRLGGSRTVYSMQPVSTKLIDFELMKTLPWSSMLVT